MAGKTAQTSKKSRRSSDPQMIIERCYEPDPDIHERLRPVFAIWIQRLQQTSKPLEPAYDEIGGSSNQGIDIQAIGWDES